MKIGIMQPYFWPYLGYFQLINEVDTFVIYDNIEYTKKGWINRNRYLCNGKDKYFTIPIEKDSDFLDVRERFLASSYDRNKLKNQIGIAYRKAPYFEPTYNLFCKCIDYEDINLFNYIFFSIKNLVEYLEIDTEIVISSTLKSDFEKKGKEKVISICKSLNGVEYINPVGGQKLYNKNEFLMNDIKLSFIQMDKIEYKQFTDDFIPSMSILDVLMFNDINKVKEDLKRYTLI
ncbi:MAG: WbqC family protein [Lachnospiraceae bacterium]|nr:WbqC family protein [Lachnospiraceae bacterium]